MQWSQNRCTYFLLILPTDQFYFILFFSNTSSIFQSWRLKILKPVHSTKKTVTRFVNATALQWKPVRAKELMWTDSIQRWGHWIYTDFGRATFAALLFPIDIAVTRTPFELSQDHTSIQNQNGI